MEVKEPDASYVRQSQLALTELGELPVDWRVAPLEKLNPIVTSGSRGWAAYYSDSGALFLRITNLSRTRIYPWLDDLKYVAIPEDDSEGVRTALQVGDVLISITADIGMIGWVPPTLSLPAYINQHIALVRIAGEQADSRYLAYFLAGAASQRRFKALTDAGAKAGMTLVGVRQQVLAALPPPAEQQAIAEALSDADALIESLSLLLAKKRQIKHGAMQELLTGKKRLPGFERAWSERRLSQFGEFLKGRGITRDQARSGNLPCVRYGEIYTCHGDVIQRYESWISPAVAAAATRLRGGDILFAGSGETKEEIGKCTAFVSFEQAYAGGDIVILRTRDASAEFLSYLLNTPPIQSQKASRGQGDAVVHISSAALADIRIFVPDHDEQVAIALAIAGMDEELSVLRAKLGKAKEIKEGMMQALLTGRIRLAPPASNVIPLPVKPAAANPPTTKPAHNWQINEAVVIGVLAQRFGSERFPLPRKRRVKLMYLLHRHTEGEAKGYLKKAAGPYDPNTKYKGPEQIALKNGYVRALRNDKYEGFVAGDKIEQALRYFEQWYGMAALDWLERFHYRKTDDLELLATVDMAMVDLAASGEPADIAGVKRVIATHPEWLPKLSREVFSDDNIARAIAECAELFPA